MRSRARSVKLRVSWALGTGFRLRLISDLTFHPKPTATQTIDNENVNKSMKARSR